MKILNYSPITFSQTNQQSKLDNIDLYNRLMKSNFSKEYFLVDRTQAIPHFLDIDYSYAPIPSNINKVLDFHSIVKNRCLELLSTGKPINIAWSGGIDSTFVLFSLYHYATDKDQIRVYGTYNSIIESGDLFDKFIKDKIKYNIRVNTSAENNFSLDDDSIFVTGAMSNQLFIPGLSYNKNRDSILDFKDNHTIQSGAELFYGDVLTDSCLEFLEPSIRNSTKQINTLQDLRWYINFNFTWYNVLTNNLIGLSPSNINRVHAFFNTDEFQIWSMTNTDVTTKLGDYSDERWQLREMISEYIGDSYYSTNKIKKTSVISPTPHSWLYLLNDYTNIYL